MSYSAKDSTPRQYAVPVSFSLILILFFTSRLMLLLAFPLENLITYGDYQHYFNLADLSRSGGCTLIVGPQHGCYPFIHYWYEFPPIFPYLNIIIYTVAGQQLKNYIFLMSFVLLLVECLNLYLLYRLAFILHGRVQAITTAWIYTALFVPTFFWLSNFDALTTLFILGGLYSLLKSKKIYLAMALGLGAMVKFLPLLLLAPIARLQGLKQMFVYSAFALILSFFIFGPFALINPELTLASLQAQAGKSSYQTVWAIIDGNDTTGNFGPLIDHFEASKAGQPVNNPARIPTWLTFIPFALLGLYIFRRPKTLPNLNLDTTIFTTLTFAIFFLWSQGWSPQWQTYLIPLLLLSLPYKRAVLFIIVLGFISFLEWPVILSRGLTDLLPITIMARTVVLILISFELYQRMTVSIDSMGRKRI